MLSITATGDWRKTHPGAMIGLLELSGMDNALPSPKLEERKRAAEARLRERYAGFTRQDFLSLPIMTAYQKYYKRFTKTYHVLLQLESIVLKGKSLPDVSPLVDANFTAEVDTLVLTAGHDAAKLAEPIVVDVSQKGDSIVRMNGEPKLMEAGDMVMRDATGVVCSIIYGQDNVSLNARDDARPLRGVRAGGSPCRGGGEPSAADRGKCAVVLSRREGGAESNNGLTETQITERME